MAEVELGSQRVFPTTMWTEIGRAGGPDEPMALQALESVLCKYYQSLQNHLVRKFNVNEDLATEWVQSFVWKKVLLDKLISSAAKERGKFRTFLLNALDNFVVSELRRENAQCRKPAGGFESFEESDPERLTSLAQQPQSSFDQEWARTVLARTLEQMQNECEAKGQTARFEVFKARVLEPILDGTVPVGYEELVNRLGFRSPSEASNALITAKRMFERVLREVIGEYASDDSEIDAEVIELQAILAGNS